MDNIDFQKIVLGFLVFFGKLIVVMVLLILLDYFRIIIGSFLLVFIKLMYIVYMMVYVFNGVIWNLKQDVY